MRTLKTRTKYNVCEMDEQGCEWIISRHRTKETALLAAAKHAKVVKDRITVNEVTEAKNEYGDWEETESNWVGLWDQGEDVFGG